MNLPYVHTNLASSRRIIFPNYETKRYWEWGFEELGDRIFACVDMCLAYISLLGYVAWKKSLTWCKLLNKIATTPKLIHNLLNWCSAIAQIDSNWQKLAKSKKSAPVRFLYHFFLWYFCGWISLFNLRGRIMSCLDLHLYMLLKRIHLRSNFFLKKLIYRLRVRKS